MPKPTASDEPKRLDANQRIKVRSLIEDEGYTRREAVAWVLAFEASGPSDPPGVEVYDAICERAGVAS